MLEMSYILYWHGRDFGQYFLPILVLQYLSKKCLIVNQHWGGQSSSYNRIKTTELTIINNVNKAQVMFYLHFKCRKENSK